MEVKTIEPPVLTSTILLQHYPEVHEFFILQLGCQEPKYEEKMKFWREKKIKCFERWTVPYFLEREKDKKKPCLRLNYRPNGQCKDCSAQCCVYDNICFMCGQEGHGAFHTHPGGKYHGQLKCIRHRNFVDQLASVKEEYKVTEEQIKNIVAADPTPVIKKSAISSSSTSTSPAKSILTKQLSAIQQQSLLSSITAATSVSNNNLNNLNNNSSNDERKSVVASIDSKQKSPKSSTITPSSALSTQMSSMSISADPKTQITTSTSLYSNHTTSYSNNSTTTTSTSTHGHTLTSANTNAGANNVWTSRPSVAVSGSGSGSAFEYQTGSTPALQMQVMHSQEGGYDLGIGPDSRATSAPTTTSTTTTIGSTPPPPPPGAAAGPPPLEYELTDEDGYGHNPLQMRLVMTSTNIVHENRSGMTIFQAELSRKSTRQNLYHSVPIAVKTRPISNNIITTQQYILSTLNSELKTLRKLSLNSPYIARIMHHSYIEMEFPIGSGMKWCAIPVELCEMNLVSYIKSFALQAQEQPVQSSVSLSLSPGYLPMMDLQIITIQLIEGYMHCHSNNICHRSVTPTDILIKKANDPTATRVFSDGYVIKLADFFIGKQLSSGGIEPVDGQVRFSPTVYTAPEVLKAQSYIGYAAASDVWSLGCVLYFISTSGQSLFENETDVFMAERDEEFRRAKLHRHGLQDRSPMLADLIERMIRPVAGVSSNSSQAGGLTRIELADARCHPFLWNFATRRRFIVQFAEASNGSSGGGGSGSVGDDPSGRVFKEGLERYAQNYVFGTNGWPERMCADFLPYVAPTLLREKGWWSGGSLLQAISNTLQFPAQLRSALFSDITFPEMLRRYLTRVIDVDFPKLLILVFELASWYGRWSWDGYEVMHHWNR